MMFDGYKEADKINQQIEKLLKGNLINKQNAIQWLNFTRVVISGLGFLRDIAIKKARGE